MMSPACSPAFAAGYRADVLDQHAAASLPASFCSSGVSARHGDTQLALVLGARCYGSEAARRLHLADGDGQLAREQPLRHTSTLARWNRA